MSLYIVHKVNGPYRPGTFIECFDHGCQVVETRTENNRVQIVRTKGVVFPLSYVEPYVKRILRKGFQQK